MAKDTFFIQSGSLYLIQGDNFKPSSSVSFSFEDPITELDTSSGLFATGSVNAGQTQSFVTTRFFPEISASAVIEIDPNDPTSFYMSGASPSASFYMSSSGRMGFGTTDPLADFDIRTNEFQIQKQGARQGIKVNREGNIESFNAETSAASTGSEFILSYTRGGASQVTSDVLVALLGVDPNEIIREGGAAAFFSGLPRQDQDKILFALENPEEFGLEPGLVSNITAGDVLGSVRWVAKSGSEGSTDLRSVGEAANITAVVNASSRFGTSADLLFKIADRAALEGASSDLSFEEAAPKTALRLDGDFNHQMTGSLSMTGNLLVKGSLTATSITSSRVTSSVIVTSGSNLFGNDSTDTHTFIGNITSSGIISSSVSSGVGIQSVTGSFDHIITAGETIEFKDGSSTLGSIKFNTSGIAIQSQDGTDANTITANVTASGNVSASGTGSFSELNIDGGKFTSASLAAAQASGDNLGNHTATQDLNLNSQNIIGVKHITASGNISSSGFVIGRTGSFTKIIINSDLSGASEPPFLISIPDTNGQNQKLQVNHQGVLRFGALDTLPTAVTGGLVYSSSAFYMGLP